MNQFDVTFYDGLSSRGVPASLSFEPSYWIVRVTRDDGSVDRLSWDTDRVRRNETASGVNTFRYESEPPQVIECRDPALLQALREHYPNRSFVEKKYAWLVSSGPVGVAALVAAVIGLVAVVYFFALPALAGLLANAMPRSTETAVGEKLYESMVSGYRIDDSLSADVNAYVRLIDFGTDYPVTVTVVEQDELNAFALPGGRVVVYSKLLREMKRHEELAALLGHEVAHVEHRHTLRALARNLSGYLLISLVVGDANAVMAVVVDNADALNRLSFSRSLERQADEDAAVTMRKNGIDLRGMVGLFQTLKAGNDFHIAGFLSTHPLTDDRLAFAREQAAQQRNAKPNAALDAVWQRIQENK